MVNEYLVVRGADDHIYWTPYLESGVFGWNRIAGGTTQSSPAASLIGDYLHIVIKGASGLGIYETFVDLRTGEDSGWSVISGQTLDSPAIAYKQKSGFNLGASSLLIIGIGALVLLPNLLKK